MGAPQKRMVEHHQRTNVLLLDEIVALVSPVSVPASVVPVASPCLFASQATANLYLFRNNFSASQLQISTVLPEDMQGF